MATTLLFAHLWQLYGPSFRLAVFSFYACTLLLVSVIDLENRLVLNKVILPAASVALLANLLQIGPGLGRALMGGAVNFGILWAAAIARRGGIGAGDVKLASLIGLITGYPQAVVALAIGVTSGGLVALFLLATRIKSRKSYIPYAPFLAIGGMAMLLYGREIGVALPWPN